LLEEHRDIEPMVLAGGQTLVPLMNFRHVKPGFLVDLQHVEGLSAITLTEHEVAIGAMVRQSIAEESPEVRAAAPLLAEAITFVSQPPVRNNGTVGGSLAHADPNSEIPAACLALDAVMTVSGPAGEREVRAGDFFKAPYTTDVGRGEILTSVRIPRLPGAHAFVEFRRTHLSHAVVGAAVLLDVQGDGVVVGARIALCGVGRTPVRATATEQALIGIVPDPASIEAAVAATVAELSPAGNVHANSETRIDITRTYLRRGIELALDRARTGGR
jgi:carbon-monoxide dehydrogenase medium subunit